jgi:hypothetical protein
MCHGEPYDEKHFAMCPCQDTRQRIPLGPTKPCRILPLTFALGPILPPHFPCGLTPPDLIPSCTWPRPPYPSPPLSLARSHPRSPGAPPSVTRALMSDPSHCHCRMDLPGPTTSVGTRTDYSVGPWDYPTCVARYLMA